MNKTDKEKVKKARATAMAFSDRIEKAKTKKEKEAIRREFNTWMDKDLTMQQIMRGARVLFGI